MFCRALLLLLALMAGRLSVVAAENGYLPTTGPVPLRFVAPRPARPTSIAWNLTPTNRNPILSNANVATTSTNRTLTGPRVVAPTSSNHVAASVLTTNAATPFVTMPSDLDPVDSGPVRSGPMNASAQSAQAVQAIMPQPQLFLQYFTPEYIPGSNGYGVVVPVGFIPPQPRSGGSSATYQVIDPEKK